MFSALYLLFMFKLRAGRNWARIVLTVLTAFQMLSVLLVQDTIAGYVSVAADIVGVVLSYTPASNTYLSATAKPTR
ncbi:hypothetical protein CFP71_15100 [Amycolatopsis thailandensis]|uniref:Uncharacterized protein n=1 Tax=Amycolatopsis thailandensis TaxID=589330 RepID=A0A229SC25_9PSEU|nr:hypothetical protein [Amycolatopsis thailandensis]OXM56144.1 hypothetical protein CFP71_15100 [Amycolatopsis thailandensis]